MEAETQTTQMSSHNPVMWPLNGALHYVYWNVITWSSHVTSPWSHDPVMWPWSHDPVMWPSWGMLEYHHMTSHVTSPRYTGLLLQLVSNINQHLFYNSTGLHPHPLLREVDPWYVLYIYDVTISIHLCWFRCKCLHSDESFYSSGSWLLALNPMPKTASQPIVTKWDSQTSCFCPIFCVLYLQ